MTVRMGGTVAHLEGDWTMTGVADTCGLQLQNIWAECTRLRGIEPKLLNVTDCRQRAIHELGFSQCFSDTYFGILQGYSLRESGSGPVQLSR
jgi:hypothetical protein